MPVTRLKVLLKAMEARILYLLGDSTPPSSNTPLTADTNLLELFELKHLYQRHIRSKEAPTTSIQDAIPSINAPASSGPSLGSYIQHLPGNNTLLPDDTLSNLAHIQQNDQASSSTKSNLIPFDHALLQRAFALQESKRPIPNLDRSWLGVEELPKTSASPESAPSPYTLAALPLNNVAATNSAIQKPSSLPPIQTTKGLMPTTAGGSAIPSPLPQLKLKIRLPSLGSQASAKITTSRESSPAVEDDKKKQKRGHDDADANSGHSEKKKKKKHKSEHHHHGQELSD